MGMTVGDLARMMKGLPPQTPIVLSKDAEGNEFSPLDEAKVGGRQECDLPLTITAPVLILWPKN